MTLSHRLFFLLEQVEMEKRSRGSPGLDASFTGSDPAGYSQPSMVTAHPTTLLAPG